jgi:hypothetical protein
MKVMVREVFGQVPDQRWRAVPALAAVDDDDHLVLGHLFHQREDQLTVVDDVAAEVHEGVELQALCATLRELGDDVHRLVHEVRLDTAVRHDPVGVRLGVLEDAFVLLPVVRVRVGSREGDGHVHPGRVHVADHLLGVELGGRDQRLVRPLAHVGVIIEDEILVAVLVHDHVGKSFAGVGRLRATVPPVVATSPQTRIGYWIHYAVELSCQAEMSDHTLIGEGPRRTSATTTGRRLLSAARPGRRA